MTWRDGETSGGLLDSWEIRGEGRSWLFTLREGACFHDGKPCTTEQVIEALNMFKNARDSFGMKSPYARYLNGFEFEVKGPARLIVRSPHPCGDLADIFCDFYVGKRETDGGPLVGTGDYRVEEYVEGDRLKLTVREGSGNRRYTHVTFYEIPEARERYRALLRGEVDVATGLQSIEESPVRRSASDEVCWQAVTNTMSVTCFLNGFAEPFCHPEARVAVNLAVDVSQIIEDVWHGLAEPAATIVSPFHFGYPTGLEPFAYDPDQAKDLFKHCAMPEELVLKSPWYMPDRATEVSRIIQRQLAAIDIPVRIEIGDDRPQYARDVGAKQIGHLAMFDSTPTTTFRVMADKVYSKSMGTWWQGVVDEEADHLFEIARRTVDPEERRKAYARCLSRLHRVPPWLYLYHPQFVCAYRHKIAGVHIDHAGLLQLDAQR